MAVRQIKVLKKDNIDIPFSPKDINPELVSYMQNYEENLINSGRVLKQTCSLIGKNKLV